MEDGERERERGEAGERSSVAALAGSGGRSGPGGAGGDATVQVAGWMSRLRRRVVGALNDAGKPSAAAAEAQRAGTVVQVRELLKRDQSLPDISKDLVGDGEIVCLSATKGEIAIALLSDSTRNGTPVAGLNEETVTLVYGFKGVDERSRELVIHVPVLPRHAVAMVAGLDEIKKGTRSGAGERPLPLGPWFKKLAKIRPEVLLECLRREREESVVVEFPEGPSPGQQRGAELVDPPDEETLVEHKGEETAALTQTTVKKWMDARVAEHLPPLLNAAPNGAVVQLWLGVRDKTKELIGVPLVEDDEAPIAIKLPSVFPCLSTTAEAITARAYPAAEGRFVVLIEAHPQPALQGVYVRDWSAKERVPYGSTLGAWLRASGPPKDIAKRFFYKTDVRLLFRSPSDPADPLQIGLHHFDGVVTVDPSKRNESNDASEAARNACFQCVRLKRLCVVTFGCWKSFASWCSDVKNDELDAEWDVVLVVPVTASTAEVREAMRDLETAVKEVLGLPCQVTALAGTRVPWGYDQRFAAERPRGLVVASGSGDAHTIRLPERGNAVLESCLWGRKWDAPTELRARAWLFPDAVNGVEIPAQDLVAHGYVASMSSSRSIAETIEKVLDADERVSAVNVVDVFGKSGVRRVGVSAALARAAHDVAERFRDDVVVSLVTQSSRAGFTADAIELALRGCAAHAVVIVDDDDHFADAAGRRAALEATLAAASEAVERARRSIPPQDRAPVVALVRAVRPDNLFAWPHPRHKIPISERWTASDLESLVDAVTRAPLARPAPDPPREERLRAARRLALEGVLAKAKTQAGEYLAVAMLVAARGVYRPARDWVREEFERVRSLANGIAGIEPKIELLALVSASCSSNLIPDLPLFGTEKAADMAKLELIERSRRGGTITARFVHWTLARLYLLESVPGLVRGDNVAIDSLQFRVRQTMRSYFTEQQLVNDVWRGLLYWRSPELKVPWLAELFLCRRSGEKDVVDFAALYRTAVVGSAVPEYDKLMTISRVARRAKAVELCVSKAEEAKETSENSVNQRLLDSAARFDIRSNLVTAYRFAWEHTGNGAFRTKALIRLNELQPLLEQHPDNRVLLSELRRLESRVGGVDGAGRGRGSDGEDSEEEGDVDDAHDEGDGAQSVSQWFSVTLRGF